MSEAIPGQTYPGVVCKGCHSPLRLGDDPDDLADPFPVKCPKCGHEATYQQREIQTLRAHRKQ